MNTAANQAAKLHNEETALRDRLESRRQAGLLAFKEVCGGEFQIPQDLSEAAAMAHTLKRQRDGLKADLETAKQQGLELRAQIEAAKNAHAKDLAELVAGEFEAEARPGGKAAVAALIARLREQKQLAERAHTVATDALTHAFIEMGLTKIPGTALTYAGKTPLVKALEGAAVYLFGNDLAKQNYLRRRDWVFAGNGAWRGPLGVMVFGTAVTLQVKEDVKPYQGLAEALLPAKTPAIGGPQSKGPLGID